MGPLTPLKQILTADAVLAQWEARRTREHALTIVVRRHLPRPLAPRIHVVDARSGELELAADAGAVAAMLRQRSADLLAALRSQGWEFTGIRVRVQVRDDPGPRPKASVNQPDRSSLQALAALARRLPRGPLKVALERFLRRAG
jgi:Dna[CI] antecedent DciA-like protein